MYNIPEEHYFRIHHVRPRFKGDIENVLLFVASEISKIPEQPEKDFADELNNAIRRYTGNDRREVKTINNWRTEISSLFGFYITENGVTRAGKRALELAENEDLVEFFKKFLFTFQYPGAHIKSHEILKQIENGVRFKPVQYILRVLQAAERDKGGREGISKAEACHCIFNDLRCTSGLETPEETWQRIKANRESSEEYDWTGDVIRYAGDIIDYMEIANLLVSYNGKFYYLNNLEKEVIQKFVDSSEWFSDYDEMIEKRTATLEEIKSCSVGWFNYVNRHLDKTDFETDLLAFIATNSKEYEELQRKRAEVYEQLLISLQIRTKDIGDMGESLVHSHECQRVKLGGRSDLIHLIMKIPTQYAVGYDIQSVETCGLKRYIEVKTTISSKPLHFNKVHLTPNEWMTAESVKDRYFIYRLMISKKEKKLFVLQNPSGLYREGKIVMLLKEGADITFDTKTVGNFEELLTWTN